MSALVRSRKTCGNTQPKFQCSFRCGESCWLQALLRFRDWFESTIHRQITLPCTSCGSASEVAVKPFLLGGALQVSFALRVLSPPFTARHNQANEIARVFQLSPEWRLTIVAIRFGGLEETAGSFGALCCACTRQ